jgi:hypothetical protein
MYSSKFPEPSTARYESRHRDLYKTWHAWKDAGNSHKSQEVIADLRRQYLRAEQAYDNQASKASEASR